MGKKWLLYKGAWALLFFSSYIQGAAPATHVYFAEQYLRICKPSYTAKEKASFIRGTLFPDIRYLARIARTKTHVKGVSLQEIKNTKDPFVAGKLFHSYVDEQREIVAQREKIYDHFALFGRHKSRFLKILEDELYYPKIDRLATLEALNSYDATEKKSGVPFYTVKAWHRHLRTYLKQSPVALFNERIKLKKGYLTLSASLVSLMATFITDYKQEPFVKKYYRALTKEFSKLLV